MCQTRCFSNLCLQDLLDATADVRVVPGWLSRLLTCLFVASTVGTAMLVTDLGAVLHMIGGTVSSPIERVVHRVQSFVAAAWFVLLARPPL